LPFSPKGERYEQDEPQRRLEFTESARTSPSALYKTARVSVESEFARWKA